MNIHETRFQHFEIAVNDDCKHVDSHCLSKFSTIVLVAFDL